MKRGTLKLETGVKARLRVIVVAVLLLAPFVFLMGVGTYHLWTTGWSFVAWWPMALSITAAYGLGWYWTRRARGVLPNTGVAEPPGYWTERDRKAWAIVEGRAADLTAPTVDQFADSKRYADEAIGLALDVARVYAPDATDPFGSRCRRSSPAPSWWPTT
jgi:hypothetical protein